MINSNNMYDLLDYHNIQNDFTDNEYVQTMKEKLVELLKSYGVYGEIVEYYMTPFAVTFVVDPDSGESIKEFKRLRVDLEVHMAWPIEIVNISEGSAAIPVHAQAAYVSYEEIDRVIDAVRKN
ncbi:hypothetical protein D6853_12950 [Butyrivibrio sp. X503]|uniref:DNA translocase FtsK n=1 Tax=Butyrivibrio sp. X503 TaxID=2364878 RepID=UPI000EA97F9B|nr:DNA translocase FtsK [Butyrivibrio sp. X503]RKM54429.1 hypothetical protein D6853_12950 [Butyrivibrio sp. X503]